MPNKVISTLIANDQSELTAMINKLKNYVKCFQLDIMDGEFVPNPSIFFDFKLPELNNKFEAHLMINDPEEWIKKHGKKVDVIIVHIETVANPQKIIDQIKMLNKKVGFALNPETSLDKIQPFLKQIDQVLIMTVKPGYYGSLFLPEMLDKISDLRKLAPDIIIEADGAISDKTALQLKEAGVNNFCTGSYLIKAENPAAAVKKINEIIE